MIVVSNSSPLIALSAVGLFDLLASLRSHQHSSGHAFGVYSLVRPYPRLLGLTVALCLLPSSTPTIVLSKLIRI